ncbi:MAG: STAS domain-containing protein [Syntrophales bacterium]|nr:STAS domain-containing protein [Syntrophales bacterium]
MAVTVKKLGEATVVSPIGRLDTISAPDFGRILDQVIAGGEKRIIVDFKNVEYISSAGLQSILAAAKKLETSGGQLDLASLKGSVLEVFEISGFTSIFKIYDSVDVALKDV